MKLYDLRTGTNTRRVRIFLAEKGVKLPTVEVDMLKGENKDPAYLSKNPMGTMPLLELDDGSQLAESVAICRYVEELYPDPPLLGTTPIERAVIEMWNRRMEFELLRPIIDHWCFSLSGMIRDRFRTNSWPRRWRRQATRTEILPQAAQALLARGIQRRAA
jgi:glutathione S-transferase